MKAGRNKRPLFECETGMPSLSLEAAIPRFLSESEAAKVDQDSVLGKVFFQNKTPSDNKSPYPCANVLAEQLQEEPLVEVWTSTAPISHHEHANIQVAATADILFGCVRQELSLNGEQLESTVYRTYVSFLNLIKDLGYQHLVRIWNYVPGIGLNIDGLECYRRFCRARYQAFADSRKDFLASLPAASAVGAEGKELTILFLASRHRCNPRENPRQISAYRYPRLYGPRSPSFARATLSPWWGSGALFISGMASIVGHESRHIGNPEKQLKEAIENVKIMVERSIEDDGLKFKGLSDLRHTRVYLRDPEYLGMAKACIEPLLDDHDKIMYLQADICRSELLVELEGALLPSK